MFFLVLCLCDLLKKATSFPDPGYFTHSLKDWGFCQILKSGPWLFLFFPCDQYTPTFIPGAMGTCWG